MPLSKIEWTDAARLALARDGLAGVAVEPLARRLGATKGSFYWHFADRAELIAATLELWEQRVTTDVMDRPADQAHRHARVAFALYIGLGELRRADPEGDPTDQELDEYLKLAVDIIMPPDGVA